MTHVEEYADAYHKLPRATGDLSLSLLRAYADYNRGLTPETKGRAQLILPGVTNGRGLSRDGGDVLERTAVVLDLDHVGDASPHAALRSSGLHAYVHETVSSKYGDHSWRVILPLSRPIRSGDPSWGATVDYAAAMLGIPSDHTQGDWKRGFFAPSGARSDPAEIPGVDLDPQPGEGYTFESPRGAKTHPEDLPGWTGAFNAVFSLTDLVGLYPEVGAKFERCANGLKHVDSTQSRPGITPIPDSGGLWYDHASSSPTCGLTFTAFDFAAECIYGLQSDDCQDPELVGGRWAARPDELPSRRAMSKRVSKMKAVREAKDRRDRDEADRLAKAAGLAAERIESVVSAPDGGSLASVEDVAAMIDPLKVKGIARLSDPRVVAVLRKHDPYLRSLGNNILMNQLVWTDPSMLCGGRELTVIERDDIRRFGGVLFSNDDHPAFIASRYGELYLGVIPPVSQVRDLLSTFRTSGDIPVVDPIREFYDSLPNWSPDGEDYIGRVCECLDPATPEWNRLALSTALVSGCARAKDHGCKAGGTLYLVGGGHREGQGWGKSVFARMLGVNWASKLGVVDGNQNRLLNPLRTALVSEAAEGVKFQNLKFDSRAKAEKDFLDTPVFEKDVKHKEAVDRIYLPGIYVVTTNETFPLDDDTEHRRALPVRMRKPFPLSEKDDPNPWLEDPDFYVGLWSQAKYMYEHGFPKEILRNTPEDAVARAATEGFSEQNMLWGTMVSCAVQWIRAHHGYTERQEITMDEFLRLYRIRESAGAPKAGAQRLQSSVRGVLESFGFEYKRVQTDGSRVWKFVRAPGDRTTPPGVSIREIEPSAADLEELFS